MAQKPVDPVDPDSDPQHFIPDSEDQGLLTHLLEVLRERVREQFLIHFCTLKKRDADPEPHF
jgi:hypothetical protein